MSEKGLLESERIASGIKAKLIRSLRMQRDEISAELEKVQFLLGDRGKAQAWANSAVSNERRQQLIALMNEVEQLYLTAGDSRGAKIFKRRMESQLKKRLTNLKANELEVSTKLARTRNIMEQDLATGLTNVRRESALREMYAEAHEAGGFLGNFGRHYLNDIVTMQTMSAGSKTIGEYMSNLFTKYEADVKDVFTLGIVRGDSYETMQNNLAAATDLTERKAGLLVRTEANAIFNQSVRDVIEDNPLVKGYRFRAVLDSRTSSICQRHDGEYIPKDKVQPGVNYPPLHPNCRSTVTTVLVTEDEKADTVQRYTKNGKNQWEKVPPGMTYLEYKEKFGFSNSKNPRTYNASTRDIHDATLARITKTQYKGYVKPSASSTARIQKMIRAYLNNDRKYMSAVSQNTGYDDVAKALLRQAQAESGFDGLPLQLNGDRFQQEVQRKGYRVTYRRFGSEEAKRSFLEGSQDYLKPGDSYGTKVFSSAPRDGDYVEIAIKTTDSKMLRVPSRASIEAGVTGDARIDRVLAQTPKEKRGTVFSATAIEYGYDVVEFVDDSFMTILNRTSAIVKGQDTLTVPDIRTETLPEEIHFSDLVKREATIAQDDSRIVRLGGTRVVPNVIGSARTLDGTLSSSVSREARQLFATIPGQEEAISKTMISVVDSFSGGKLEGLENVMKTGSSTESKIARKKAASISSGVTMTDEQALREMTDLIRYTVVVEHDDIGLATEQVMNRLEGSGIRIVEVDNKWIDGSGEYKAVHLLGRTKQGTTFEIQVHSDLSLKVKNENHELYEIQRKVGVSVEEKERLGKKMRDNTQKMPLPKGIEGLRSFRRK